MADLDWAEMEGLFCQQVPPVAPPTASTSSIGSGVESDKRRREPTEVSHEKIYVIHYLSIIIAKITKLKFLLLFADCAIGREKKLER